MPDAKPAYLHPIELEWGACLRASFAHVRQSWQTEWIGLPTLLSQCLTFLHIPEHSEDPTVRCLVEAARAVALQIEIEKGCGANAGEPGYHNRLHFADALTTVALQCYVEALHNKPHDAAWQAALLLAGLAHDFRHPGGVNRHPRDIESATVEALTPFLESANLAPVWTERITTLILRSDFTMAHENHARVRERAFAWDLDWATVLLNEADIMASASEEFGPALSEALASEWKAIQFPAYATVATEAGRRQFLAGIHFSTHSGRVLRAGLDRDYCAGS